jgi:esterase/lipase superfamily enzyme
MVTGYDHVRVYFATTREYDASATPDRAFTNTGTKKEWINYGTAEVSVPLPHSEGAQKGIKAEKIDIPKGDPQREFRVLTAAETANPKRPLIVFVHGFNNTFETAAERAAMYAYDLQPDVSTKAAIFSWPSKESLFGYLHDEDSVLVNQDRARQVLGILRTHDSASPVVLIGHSMGCRVLTFALREIELISDRGGSPKRHPQFAQLILIEPDVNPVFQGEHRAHASRLWTRHDLCVEPR